MQSYSPFSKPIREVQTEDLQSLKDASEGWYIEYKQEAPNASGLAKAISAFANTYGGWLFLGVQEESKENSVAGAFPGISKEEVDPVLQRMRKSAADHLNPTPHFETVVLWGPDLQLGLEKDRAVIAAWVPQSASAPHVHKSGLIYRRVSDGSEPRAENDRFVLDQLWRRADDIKRRHKEWYDRDPEFSDSEKANPCVRLMLVADRWAERDLWIDANEDQIREILNPRDTLLSSLPFDTVYTSADGFIGRQLIGNDPNNQTLTWRIGRTFVSDIIIPLPLYKQTEREKIFTDLHGYNESERFISILGKHRTSAARIVDLNYYFNILVGIVEIQERLCKLVGWTENYHLKVKLMNSWRTIPFVDIPQVMGRFEKYGLPMCLDSLVSLPGGTGPTNYFKIERHMDADDPVFRISMQAIHMFAPLAIAYGIPWWLPENEQTENLAYNEALSAAGRRGMEVQKNRNSRQH